MSERSPGPIDYLKIYLGVPLLGLICLAWSLIALPAQFLLPPAWRAAFGRGGISGGFRGYVMVLRAFGLYRIDTTALDALRHERAVVLAPNHPSLIDAVVLLAYHPNMVCVMKASLGRNLFLGAGARLAQFVSNTPPRRMIGEAVAALRSGAVLLLFPEGTRTVRDPVNPFQLTVGAIAKHAQAAVVPVLIEADSAYLSKGWPLFRVPVLPVTYRVRLGRRFPPPSDVRRFTVELEEYFRRELTHSALSPEVPGAVATASGKGE